MMARLPVMMALDADGDGELSASEIEGAVAALKKLDKNSDGKLSGEELMPPGMPALGPMAGPLDPEEMVSRMMAADANRDGLLDKTELPPPMQPMLARADSDGDGKLSKEELTQFAKQRAAMAPGRGRPDGGPEGGRGGQRGPRDDAQRSDSERPKRPQSE